MVLILCTSSDDAILFVQSSVKISQKIPELLNGHNFYTKI